MSGRQPGAPLPGQCIVAEREPMTATMTTAEAWGRYTEHADALSREQLILQHQPLVKYVIGRLALHLPQVVDYDDMLSYGTVGLIQALDRYDPTRGVKF